MEHLFSPEALVSLFTLSILEIVLGIDNIIFLSILVVRLPLAKQEKARRIGLVLALFFRIGLLFAISILSQLTTPLLTIFSFALSGRDLIMLTGGLFLIAKSTMEIHNKLEGEEHQRASHGRATLSSVLIQIVLLDIVFSLDSVVTAVGLSNVLAIMIAANVIAMLIMLVSARAISDFVHNRPTIKMLALAFLLMVGFVLFIEGLHVHVEKGYIYVAMTFSFCVEMLNTQLRRRTTKPVQLRESRVES